MTISLSRSLTLGASLVLAACGGDGLTLPPDGAAANVRVVSGNGQGARVNATLDDSLVVEVTDTRGRPVADAEVLFEFTADGSSASPASVSTDANGIAWSHLTLGSRVGPVNGMVRVPVDAGVAPVEVAITATAIPGDANEIELFSGNDQEGAVGTALPLPLVVAVTDAAGNPIPNVPIVWSVTGGGSLSETSNLTDANGKASVIRTLGATAGPQTTVATATGLAGSPVTFAHTATAGSATRVEKVSGDNQSAGPGEQLDLPLVVRVLDGANNPIPNRAVTWVVGTGGGTAAPENTTTDAEGHARTEWTLGSAAGSQTLNAVVSGVETATFTATARAGGPSASRSRVDLEPDRIPAGGSSTIIVRVRDASNNRLAGVSVSATSSVSGDAISPSTATTDEDGVATFSFSSSASGERTITAVAGGVTLNERPVLTVLRLGSTTEITSVTPEPSTSGEQITVTFRVAGEGAGTPTGTVTIFSLQETGGCEVPVSQGSCSFPLDQPGTHQLRASYSGDAQFESSSDPDGANHVVNPATPTNQPPTAGPDTYSTPGLGMPLAVPAPGVLANDSDPDGDPLSAQQASDPPLGSVSLNSDGAFTYTPDPGATGTDSFTYLASDGSLTTQATVTITITP